MRMITMATLAATTAWGLAGVSAEQTPTVNEEHHLFASDGEGGSCCSGGDNFGNAVSVSGDVVIVGSGDDDTEAGVNAGSAYIYRLNGSIWVEEEHLFAGNQSVGNYFGKSVSISGNVAVVGVPGDDTTGHLGAGSVYVYRFNGTSWVEEAHLFASDGTVINKFGYSVSVSGDPGSEVVLIGSFGYDSSEVANTGRAFVFRFNGTEWVEEAHLFASDGVSSDLFGLSVSVSGNVAIVGAQWDDTGAVTNAGSAYVYRYNGTSWEEEAHLFASDGSWGDEFGGSVSISGNVAIVGTKWDDTGAGTDAGSAYVYRYNGTTWVEEKHLFASDGTGGPPCCGDRFGESVSICGNVAVVGAYYDDTSVSNYTGSAYIYRWSGSDWMEVRHIIASDGAFNDNFGRAVSVSGDVVIAGAPGDDTAGGFHAGSAYVFSAPGLPSPMVSEDHHIFASDGEGGAYPFGDRFGNSVSVSDNVLLVGAPWDDTAAGNGAGSAYVYRYTGTTWVEEVHLFASDGQGGNFLGDLFGGSVSISGNVALIGASRDNTAAGTAAGSAYVYRYNGTTWVEETHLFASDGAAHDSFGISVSVSGGIAIIGAYSDDTTAGNGAGSAYVYRYNGNTWVEEAHLFASDGEGGIQTGDQFGVSVSISGNVAIVGAYKDDSTGGGTDTGSAYIYRYNGKTWVEEAHLISFDGAEYDLFGNSVSISDNVAVVGAVGDDLVVGANAGSSYVYRYNGTVWEEEAHLFAMDGQGGISCCGDGFGSSVSVHGNVIIAGAVADDSTAGINTGSAYIFRFNGSAWVEEEHLFASDQFGGDAFGRSVSISGDVAIVGAGIDDTPDGNDAGSVYVFGPPVIVCREDITPSGGDGVVDLTDLMTLINNFGSCPLPEVDPCAADIAPPGPPAGNGVVNIDDLVALLNAFGPCP